jgi:hypothetical protein
MTRAIPIEKTRIFFGDIDFQQFTYSRNEDGDFLMTEDKAGIVIDHYIHHKISDFLCRIHSIKKKPELPGNEFTKKILIDEDREKRKRRTKENFQSQMLPLISSMVNSSGFKYSIEDVRDLKIFAFMDSVMRVQTIKSAEQLTAAYYAGNIDTKKFDTKKLNWLAELKT